MREKQLLKLVAEGRRKWPSKLMLSPNSVETYRARLVKKPDVPARAE